MGYSIIYPKYPVVIIIKAPISKTLRRFRFELGRDNAHLSHLSEHASTGLPNMTFALGLRFQCDSD